MTNLEVIKHLIGSNVQLSDERLTIAAQLAGITPTDEYSDANKCAVYRVAISEIQTGVGVKKISEGDYSIEYDLKTTATVFQLANESGCADLIDSVTVKQPKVEDKSYMW